MNGSAEGIPILYGRDSSGALRFIDDVDNGEACGCFCPDPSCGQPLVAKNGGTSRIHHFAHKRGSCSWSAEYAISEVACELAAELGQVGFPALSSYDYRTGAWREIASARMVPIEGAALEAASGRRAPEVVLSARGGRRFAVVLSLTHQLRDEHVERLEGAGYADVVHIDLKVLMDDRKAAEGKHFDREGLLAELQGRGFISRLLTDLEAPCKTWAANGKRADMERESLREGQRRLQEDAARREAAARAREEEEARREQRARAAEEERQRRIREYERENELIISRSEEAAAACRDEARLRAAALARYEAGFLYGPGGVGCPRTGSRTPTEHCRGCAYCSEAMCDGVSCCYSSFRKQNPFPAEIWDPAPGDAEPADDAQLPLF